MDYNAVWTRALGILSDTDNGLTNRTVYGPLRVLDGQSNIIHFACTDEIHQSFCIREKTKIEKALYDASSIHMQAFFSCSNSKPASDSEPLAPAGDILGEENPEAKQTTSRHRRSNLNPELTFDSFVVGNSNQFAYSVCRSIVNPGLNKNNFNPLFLYGGSGLGKTHLIQAIGNYVNEHYPEKRVVYVQCEAFLNEFITNIQTKSFETFRKKYRNCDYLLIDDIQFLQNKETTQEEFFHTFNALYENGSQIVLTCDKPPQQLNSMEDRLITRFRSGVMVDIQAPDYETRMAILNNMAISNHIEVDEEIIDYIATNISSNVRELGGAFKKIMAYSMLSGKITLPMTVEILKDTIHPQGKRTVTPDLILSVVCSYYNLSKNDIMSKRRDNLVLVPRQVCMYLFRTILEMTFSQISAFFLKKDHTTAKSNCDKIEEMLRQDEDPQLAKDIEELRRRITL